MIQHDATCYLSPVTCHLYLRSAGSCTYYPYLRRYPILQILYMTYDTDPPPAEIMKAVKRIDHRLKNILIQSAETLINKKRIHIDLLLTYGRESQRKSKRHHKTLTTRQQPTLRTAPPK